MANRWPYRPETLIRHFEKAVRLDEQLARMPPDALQQTRHRARLDLALAHQRVLDRMTRLPGDPKS